MTDPREAGRQVAEQLKGHLEKGGLVVRQPERLLTPAEVAAIFRVDPKTVTRWAVAGRLKFIRTLGGHRRFYESEINELMDIQQP